MTPLDERGHGVSPQNEVISSQGAASQSQPSNRYSQGSTAETSSSDRLPGNYAGQAFAASSYTKLGGFLAFIVYANYVGAALIVLSVIVSVVSTIGLLGQFGYFGSFGLAGTLIAILIVSCICELAEAAFSVWWATLIKNRDPSFLKIYHIVGIVALIIAFIYGFVNAGILGALLYVVLYGIGLFLFTLYFVKSVRVRTYFGSDQYLRESPFTKNVVAPQPADVGSRSGGNQ